MQGTLPSSPKQPSLKKTMWRGVIISYIQIAMTLFPLAIVGFSAYGNKVSAIFNFQKYILNKSYLKLPYMLNWKFIQ